MGKATRKQPSKKGSAEPEPRMPVSWWPVRGNKKRALKPYRQLWLQHGGPINISGFDPSHFPPLCFFYPLNLFQGLIDTWQKSPAQGVRHWPHLAFAVREYKERIRDLREPGRQYPPSEIRKVLIKIQGGADGLIKSMTDLECAVRGTEWEEAHLTSLNQMIEAAAAGIRAVDGTIRSPSSDDYKFDKFEFTRRLFSVKAAAKDAFGLFDPKLLRSPGVAKTRPLIILISIAMPIWESLTARRPSVNKTTKVGQEAPDFVLFVQELARIAGGPVPTFKSIVVAFKNATPPFC